MELKIRRFSELLAIFFILNSLTVILDEVSTYKYSLYSSSDEFFETSLRNKYRAQRHFDYSLVLQRCDTNDFQSAPDVVHSSESQKDLAIFLGNQSNDLDDFITVGTTEDIYYNSKLGDSFWVYYTPFYKRIQGIVKFRSPDHSIQNPTMIEISETYSQSFLVAFIVIFLSFVAYKTQRFEFKFGSIVFAVIFSIVQNWWL